MLGLRTTIYKVSDMAAAKKWYSAAFQRAPYFDESYYIGFNVGGYELGLQPETQIILHKPETVLTYWGVINIREEYQRLLKLGATEHESPMNVGGELMVATVKDPWQNIIGLIYNPAFQAEE